MANIDFTISFRIKPLRANMPRKVVELTSAFRPQLYDVWQLTPAPNVRIRALVEAVAVAPPTTFLVDAQELPLTNPHNPTVELWWAK